jgi:hypothetical protein
VFSICYSQSSFHVRALSAIAQDGAATILTQSILAVPRGPFRLVPGLLRRQLQQLIAADLGRLKDLIEAEVPLAAG